MDESAGEPGRIFLLEPPSNSEGAVESGADPEDPLEVVAHVARRTFTPLAPQPGGSPSRVTSWTVKYIASHFAENIKLEDLARGAQLSKYLFLRKFRLEVGITPGAYLKRYRIVQAMDHLTSSRRTIREIGQMVGYRDPAAFSRAFAQIAGTQPYLYRVTRRSKVAEEKEQYG
jgi:AraC-like DNA-binding protein